MKEIFKKNDIGMLLYDELITRYGVTLNMKELGEVLHYTPKSINTLISADKFPVKTFTVRRRRLADARDVVNYLNRQRSTAS